MVMKEKEPFDHITNLYSKFYTKILSAITLIKNILNSASWAKHNENCSCK